MFEIVCPPRTYYAVRPCLRRLLGLLSISAIALTFHARGARAQSAAIDGEKALVDQYCAVCHNDDMRLGSFSWSSVDVAHPENNAEQAEQIIRKLRAGMMPPAGMARPDEALLESLAASLASRIDLAAASRPHAAPPALHRVNRREYRNWVRDLLDLDVDVAHLIR